MIKIIEGLGHSGFQLPFDFLVQFQKELLHAFIDQTLAQLVQIITYFSTKVKYIKNSINIFIMKFSINFTLQFGPDCYVLNQILNYKEMTLHFTSHYSES